MALWVKIPMRLLPMPFAAPPNEETCLSPVIHFVRDVVIELCVQRPAVGSEERECKGE
jgi:hypothetical protein